MTMGASCDCGFVWALTSTVAAVTTRTRTPRRCSVFGIPPCRKRQASMRGGLPSQKLELQPQPKLQAPAKILRVYVGGLSELTAGHTHIRIVVIHVIQGVEGVHVQLELEPLRNREILIQ